MRIIIVSDNHGNQNILKILYHIYSSLYKDNVKFIHLGDSQTTSINDLNNFICVKGNNDTLDLPKFQRLTVLDKRIHFSHGDEGLDEIKKKYRSTSSRYLSLWTYAFSQRTNLQQLSDSKSRLNHFT